MTKTPFPSSFRTETRSFNSSSVAIVEGIALSAPAAGKPQAIHIDKHRNTIIAGFALAIVLYLLWEILF